MYDYLIVGAGFSGAVLAELLASQLKKKVLLIDRRSHFGGNAYDSYNPDGILIHNYGPHIFHTNNKIVVDYLSQFTKWRAYEHRVLASLDGKLYPIPINRRTISLYFNIHLGSDQEADLFIADKKEHIPHIMNSEDVIVNSVGRELFEKFFCGYTKKQWQKEPKNLAPGVCGRIQPRTNTDDRYFSDVFQGIPADGYHAMFRSMLSDAHIEFSPHTDFRSIGNDVKYDKLIYTGPIDEFFDFQFGKLEYRSIQFVHETIRSEVFQPAAQINYCDETVEYTRVNEWKYLTGQVHQHTAITREYPVRDGEPYYPIPAKENHLLYQRYRKEAQKFQSIYFVGRLAEYQYYNMDQVVARALALFAKMSRNP